MSAKIILLYGHPISGKSTAAARIAQALPNAETIASARIRLRGKPHGSTAAFVDENNKRTRKTKDWAYSQLCKKARKLLLEGKIPVLDATFHKRYRRKWVYEMARKTKADVYIVWTVFGRSVKSVARERSREKKALHTENQYLTMVRQTDELEGSELKLKIIKFDRSAGKVKRYNCGKDEFAKRLAEAVASYSQGQK